MWRLAGVFSIFLAALSWLYFLATIAPALPENETLQFPSSLEDLKKTAAILTRLFDQVNNILKKLFISRGRPKALRVENRKTQRSKV